MNDWSTVTFRASSWGNLMTEPVTKADKEAGVLSKTCQKELIKIYNQVKYGRKKDVVTKYMEKGILAEQDSIVLLSRVMGKIFDKNGERMDNEWFTGHPDLICGDEVWDVKTSWDLDTFMPKLIEEPDSAYDYQLQCYYSLTGAQGGGIAYCLVDCPESVLMAEKRKLLYSMDVISEESPEYKRAEAELVKMLTFPDIPPSERVITKKVPRDDEKIAKMKAKVPKMRKWLEDFDKLHMNQYK